MRTFDIGIAVIAVIAALIVKKELFPVTKSGAQVILVTGASSGLGKACALQLVQDGHIVYGAARRVQQMNDLVQAGGYAVALDITNEQDIQSAVKRIMEEQGRIDVLVNNAGYGCYGPIEEVSMEEARQQLDVNIFGLARLTQEVLPSMRSQKQGTIINMSSMVGRVYIPFGGKFCYNSKQMSCILK